MLLILCNLDSGSPDPPSANNNKKMGAGPYFAGGSKYNKDEENEDS